MYSLPTIPGCIVSLPYPGCTVLAIPGVYRPCYTRGVQPWPYPGCTTVAIPGVYRLCYTRVYRLCYTRVYLRVANIPGCTSVWLTYPGLGECALFSPRVWENVHCSHSGFGSRMCAFHHRLGPECVLFITVLGRNVGIRRPGTGVWAARYSLGCLTFYRSQQEYTTFYTFFGKKAHSGGWGWGCEEVQKGVKRCPKGVKLTKKPLRKAGLHREYGRGWTSLTRSGA